MGYNYFSLKWGEFMVNHVKLEIAIQLAAEKIANIFQKAKKAKTAEEAAEYLSELEEAFNEKELIERGNMKAIEKILKENQKENGLQMGE